MTLLARQNCVLCRLPFVLCICRRAPVGPEGESWLAQRRVERAARRAGFIPRTRLVTLGKGRVREVPDGWYCSRCRRKVGEAASEVTSHVCGGR